MPRYPDEPITAIRERLFDGMAAYLDSVGPGCGYSWHDINDCGQIIDRYLTRLDATTPLTQKQIRQAVKDAVTALNALNRRCDGALVETDQREILCQLILVTARRAGLDTEADITEEWRAW